MRVVIVGGGFGGVKAALELVKDKKVSVTLVTDKDHFLFYPALYSTATGRSWQQSVLPLSEIFKNDRIKVVRDSVVGLDTVRRFVVTTQGQVHYDRVIFALGVVTSYFGIAGLDTYSFSIKSATEIERFKKHLHDELTSQQRLDKNYIIVGAGPTGVELAASLTGYLRRIGKRHMVKNSRIRLSLVEAAPRVLPRMSERSSALITKQLKKVGVTVMTGKKVESEDDDSIIISGTDIPSKTVVWTSGVANHPFFAEHSDIFKLAPNGRVEVDSHLRVDKHIYVIGDNANTPYTGLAQTAIHDAHFVAKAIRADVRNQPLPEYRPRKQPVVVPVGENWALFEYGPLRFSGWLGSLVLRAAHLMGYLDFFPATTAARIWLSSDEHDEACFVCKYRF